jgi:hypothetical protein
MWQTLAPPAPLDSLRFGANDAGLPHARSTRHGSVHPRCEAEGLARGVPLALRASQRR